jgi:acyl-CoA thioesterase FadM
VRHHLQQTGALWDTISCNAVLKTITPARLVFEQKVTNLTTNECLVEPNHTLACVSAIDFSLMRILKQWLKP